MNYQVIKVNDIIDNQNNGDVYFSMENGQFPSDSIMAVDVQYEDSTDYYWYGQNQDGSFNLTVIRSSSGYAGTIIDENNNTVYRIFPIDGMNSILVEYGSSITLCDSEYNEADSILIEGDCDRVCAGHLDILFLITPEAQEWLVTQGMGVAYFEILISDLKQAWINSNIPHTVDYTWESFEWSYDSLSCTKNAENLAIDGLAQAARTRNSADIVVLIGSEFSTSIWSNATACVAQFGPDDANAYIVIPVDKAINEFVFVHEVGHMYGAQHEYLDIKRGDCAFAHIIRETPSIYTLMHSNSEPRILHYSNPDIKYLGMSTGHKGDPGRDHNNAGRIRTTGCELAAFEESAIITVLIEYDVDDVTCDLNLNASIDPGPADPNYVYTRYWSYDGLFTAQYPGQLLGSGNNLTVPIPVNDPCKYFFVQVIVTLNGNTVTKEVIGIRGKDCNGSACSNGTNQTLTQKLSDIEKSTNDFNISPLQNPSVIINIALYDLYGNLVLNKSSKDSVFNYLHEAPIGIYLMVTYRNNGSIDTQKIVNNHK